MKVATNASANAAAWSLACALMGREGLTMESAFSVGERSALASLAQLKAVKQQALDLRYVLCPYCLLQGGAVVQGTAGLLCQCPDCGPVALDLEDRRAWAFQTDWLIRMLRSALEVAVQHAPVSIMNGVWRIGICKGHPLLLARSLNLVMQHPKLLSRTQLQAARQPWLITPRPHRPVDWDPLGEVALWLPMEDRFSIYGGRVQFHDVGAQSMTQDTSRPVNGPFSQDFRTVHLPDWQQGAIRLTLGQAAIFRVLWQEEGRAILGERLMRLAQSSSDKPYELFKIKSKNKGDVLYEGPLHAYLAWICASSALAVRRFCLVRCASALSACSISAW